VQRGAPGDKIGQFKFKTKQQLPKRLPTPQSWTPEIASIYLDEEERERNRPRRKAVPNPALEADMDRYRQKIEKRFLGSEVNLEFKMPRYNLKPTPRK